MARVLLTCTFWAFFLLPGWALGRGWLPGLGRVEMPARSGGLGTIAYGYAYSLLLLSPVSLLCYALHAPLWTFSAAVCCSVLWALVGLVRARAWRSLRRPSLALLPTSLILAALLFLQAQLGAWLDGDATYHLAKIRRLLEHGFDNRDLYLREYRFAHAYHSNLLLPVYAALAQLTRQNELTSWFYTEVWAKLLVAAGHFVLGQTLSGQRSVGFLLACVILVLNAGETYALYPNTLCVGWLLPLLLASGFRGLSAAADEWRRRAAELALLVFVLAQVHGVYAVYGLLILGPILALGSAWPRRFAARPVCAASLLALLPALPFVLISAYGFRDPEPVTSAPDAIAPPAVTPVRPAGLAEPIGEHRDRVAPQKPETAVSDGGHLEKVLDATDSGQVSLKPERMGGLGFVSVGFVALGLGCVLYTRRRLQLAAAAFASVWLAVILFVPACASLASRLLQGHFVVARLSTVLTSCLVFGVCAVLCWPLARAPERVRKGAYAALTLFASWGATFLPGHAPVRFRAHWTQALAPEPQRHAQLDRLLERQTLLRAQLPAGSTVLTTPRFARQVVMLTDCYVLAADRGHTHVLGVDKRRRDLVFMNAAETPWPARARLIQHYGLRYVTFERRWQRRYAWAYQHGKLLGSAAGQDLIELD